MDENRQFGDYIDCIQYFVRITKLTKKGRFSGDTRERKSLLQLVDADNNDDDAERKTIEMTMEDIKTTPTTRVQQKKVYCTTNKDNKS